MTTPPALISGDKVAIVSTARKMLGEEIAPAIEVIQEWGLEVLLGEHLFSEDHQFAGTDEQRTADLQWALDNPEIKAIICARGGYGTVRIVDRLDFCGFMASPKWVVGYSDITVLHSDIHVNYGIETLHATMPINFARNTHEALNSMQSALFGEPVVYVVGSDKNGLNTIGKGQGDLVGGNLSILCSLIGTQSDFETGGKILFLEDLDEYLYHIDRMILNLKRAGKLENLAGLVVGGMTDMNDNTIPFGKSAEEIIAAAVADYDYPVCFGFPAGHIDDNRALIMGRTATLEVGSSETTLTFAQ